MAQKERNNTYPYVENLVNHKFIIFSEKNICFEVTANMAPNTSRLEIKQGEWEKAWYLCKDGWLIQKEEDVPQTMKMTLTSPVLSSLRLGPYHIKENIREPKYDFFQHTKMPDHQKG